MCYDVYGHCREIPVGAIAMAARVAVGTERIAREGTRVMGGETRRMETIAVPVLLLSLYLP